MKKILATVFILLSGLAGASADNISVGNISMQAGETKTVSISLTNTATNLVSFQMDLTLPEGISINKAGCSLSSRFGDPDQVLAIGKRGDNVYRLNSISFALTPISGTSGTIITLSLTASTTSQGGTATLSNILFVTSATENVTISNATFNIMVQPIQVEQTLALTTLPSMTYGDATYTLPQKTAEGLTLTWTSANTAVATVSGNTLTVRKAGTATITATQAGNNYYLPFSREFTLTVAKAALTITANDCTKMEGEANPELTVSYEGFKNGDTEAVLTQQPTVTTTATKSSPAGTYPITASGAQAANYDITYISGTMTVEERHIIFADANVKALCVQNWDTNGDGELSEAEAAAVTDLGTVFKGNTTITSFDELQYFTGLTNIGNEAFRDCSGLTSVTIPSSVTSIGESAFRECSGLTSVNIPESVTSIGKWAFYHCNKLTSVTIPNSVESIGLSAFYLCSSLTSMTIPNSVTSIGNAVFSQCTSLTSITVENGNSYYVSENGVLFNKNKTSLLCFPAGKTQSTYAIPESVTEIRPYAFDHCRSLTSVTIPNSVTSIGNYAFYWCTGLTSVTIPSSVTVISDNMFQDCRNLTSVTIPNSITSIGEHAFYRCLKLTSVTIPSSVTSIGNWAFQDCSRLTSVTVEMETPLTITELTFTNRANATLYVPAGSKAAYEAAQFWQDFNIVSLITFADANVKALCVQNWDTDGDGELSETEAAAVTDLGVVFKGNTTITSFDELLYFTGLTSIGDEAFRSCSALTSVTIPNSVTSIGQHAFHSCIGLTTVTIPESVTGIGFAAFHQCHSLATVTIPASVTNISGAAFGECSSLSSIVVENGNNAYISENGVVFNKDKTTIICYPAGKVQTEFTIPESVTSIIYDAFSGCSRLMSVTIPNSMTTIGKIAFQNCTGLTSVTIPSSVTGIGDGAFNGCSNLTSVTVEKETPLTIAENTFSNRANATLYVPAGCKAAYEAAEYWQDFNIVELSPFITFADANAKALCVQNWDTDGDGELSEAEAAAVTDLGEVFKQNKTITSFDELQYFTGLTSIGEEAFRGCSSLTSVTIPNGVTTIGNNAFLVCNGLTSVTIPESVTSIGNAAFSNCNSLTSIIVENGNSSFVAENGVLFNKNKTSLLCYPAGKTESTYTIPSSVTSIGRSAFNGCSKLTSVTIPNSVTSIGIYAFNGCSRLTSVTIPNSVTTLGYYAFYQCTGLTSVSIGNSVTSIGMSTFRQCTSLNSITIPNSVTRIDMEAFKGCTSLTSATIPESVTSIGVQAFKDCPVLTSVQVGMESPLTIDSEAFTNRANATLYVPAGCKASYEAAQYWQDFNIVSLISFADANVKALCVQNWDTNGDGELSEAEAAAVTDLGTVFKGNTTITSFDELQYFTGLASIGDEAFRSCSALTSVTIPNSVTSIGHHAFHSCIGLTTVTIPESVTGIGFASFYQCSSLTSVSIPASVTNIVSAAFGRCSSLTSIEVENGNNTYISENGVLFNKDKTTIICFPAGNTPSEYTIPESVTSIFPYAFDFCSTLTSVNIPNSVTSIGKNAFQNCTGLTSVTIPNSVTSIGDGAFNGCSNLTAVTVEMETPLTITELTFTNRANATLYVPAGCKAAYEAAQYWQDFTIEEMESPLEPTDISQLDNVIYMEPQEVPIGSRGTLSFKMKNNVPIRGFQFDLYLPEGMTVATFSNGKVQASLDATKLAEGDSHQLTTSIQPDGSVLFLCNSQYDENFAVGDDIMMTVKVSVSEDMTEGEYPVELKTVKLSETDISKYYLTELVRSKVTVGSYLLGDVNADGVVDISDYISMANYIHGNVAEGFVFRAGDIDGNGSIDISDYIGVSNIIHTGSPSGNSQAGAKAALFPSEESQDKDPE